MGQSPYWPSVVATTSAAPVTGETPPGGNGSAVHGRPGGVGVFIATMFIVAEMAGAGILNLPAAIEQTGRIMQL